MESSLNKLIESISNSLSYGEILAGEQLAKISATIVKARIEKGMTQKEFAKFMGVSQSMVSKWESEDYNYTIEAIANICEKLDLDMDVVLKPKKQNEFLGNNIIPFTWKANNTNTITNMNGAA